MRSLYVLHMKVPNMQEKTCCANLICNRINGKCVQCNSRMWVISDPCGAGHLPNIPCWIRSCTGIVFEFDAHSPATAEIPDIVRWSRRTQDHGQYGRQICDQNWAIPFRREYENLRPYDSMDQDTIMPWQRAVVFDPIRLNNEQLPDDPRVQWHDKWSWPIVACLPRALTTLCDPTMWTNCRMRKERMKWNCVQWDAISERNETYFCESAGDAHSCRNAWKLFRITCMFPKLINSICAHG